MIWRPKFLWLLFLPVLLMAVMAQSVMAASTNSDPLPSIKILDPEEGAVLSGKVTIGVSVDGGKGQMGAIYFDMVGLTHQMIKQDSFYTTVVVDTTEYYDGEHLINVHVHPHSGNEFHVGKLKVVTSNDNPAPNGDVEIPQLKIIKKKMLTDANLLNIRVQLDDDSPIEGAQVLAHINRAIGRASSGKNLDMEDSDPKQKHFQGVYRVHLLPFQSDKPKKTTIRFFITDAVGRANLVSTNVLIPARTLKQQNVDVPSGKIMNIDSFQEFIPEKVHVKLENAHMASDVLLWLGDKRIKKVSLEGTETEVHIPVNVKMVKEFFKTKIGEPSRATAVWIEFRPKVSAFPQLSELAVKAPSDLPKNISVPVLGHTHINPVDIHNPIRPVRTIFNVRPYIQYVQDDKWKWLGGDIVRPARGEWAKVSFTVPSEVTSPIKKFGINFNGKPFKSNLEGSIYIDQLKVGAEHLGSFEEGEAISLMKNRGGITSIMASTAESFKGDKSLELGFSGKHSKGSLIFKKVSELLPGDEVSFYIYAPGVSSNHMRLVHKH